MFPWLFPYSAGNIGDQWHKGLMSDAAHKRHLLMYHDKWFQMDHEFCLTAFNHEQFKDATTGGFLMTEKNNFDSIAEWLVNIDPEVLKGISKCMVDGEKIHPESGQEKACFDILKDIDHVGAHVSLTSTTCTMKYCPFHTLKVHHHGISFFSWQQTSNFPINCR